MATARNAGRARLKQSPKNEIVVEEIPIDIPGGPEESETQTAVRKPLFPGLSVPFWGSLINSCHLPRFIASPSDTLPERPLSGKQK
jgi:hypothetical protein